ncbi:MAG TPA: ABC transporter ATP-binding protein [Burkholderiaceae bacterium]
MANEVMLQVDGLKVAYGGIQAVKGVSFEVREGELVSLIGANGAGKTTTLKAVTGIQPVAAGDIKFLGKSIRGQGAWDLVKQGLVMVPEGRGTFTRMTITENLLMGAHVRRDDEIEADIDYVFTEFPRLKERATQLAGTMSGGEQQMLAMGRALMARPKVLLLDEPSMGLSPIMVDKIFEVIQKIHKEKGTTVLLVEQNASRALGIADRGYVMESGEVTMDGPADMLLHDPKVRAAYLGEGE